jgi:hypothetical protein
VGLTTEEMVVPRSLLMAHQDMRGEARQRQDGEVVGAAEKVRLLRERMHQSHKQWLREEATPGKERRRVQR